MRFEAGKYGSRFIEWFSSMEMDTISELDPATGKITLYPFLFPENGMRDFFQDAEGRVWRGSQANNRVGYFYLAGSAASQRASLDAHGVGKYSTFVDCWRG
jgi:hypothetical protein